MNFLVALLPRLMSMLEEKPHSKGKKANASRLTLLGLCGAILALQVSNSKEHNAKLDAVSSTIASVGTNVLALDTRLVRVETRLDYAVTGRRSVTPAASPSSNADSGVNAGAKRFDFVRKGDR